jgi:hypothetical protein
MRVWITVDLVEGDLAFSPDMGTATTRGYMVGASDGSEALCLVNLEDSEEDNLPVGRTTHGYEVEVNGARGSIPAALMTALCTEASRLGSQGSWNPSGFNI